MSWFAFNFQDFAFSFLSVLVEGIPFLLLGSLISGLVDVFVSSERLAKMLPKNPAAAIMMSGLLGLVFPMCECGSVIVIRRFIRKGLPMGCAITYMLGAPIVSPIVALSTFAAFKGQNAILMTTWRMALGYAIAVAVGFIVHRLATSTVLNPRLVNDLPNKRSGFRFAAAPTAPTDIANQRDFAEIAAGSSLGRKLRMAMQSATADFLDVAFFFVIGTAITSVLSTAINRAIVEPVATNTPVAIAVLMLLAAALALCSTSDAFIAATQFTSFPFAAKLAFLVFGPMFDLKLFWLYGLIFRRRFVILLSLGLFVAIWFICWRVSALPL
jgi:uncharacterized membrane protein YraQ (UPF0718 family)